MLALLLLAAAVDPRALLERAIAVEKEALPERSRYFAREDVRVTRIEGERRKQLSWTTFEAMMVEGRVQYRQVARNGKPLKKQEQKLEPESKRFALKLTQVLEHHEVEMVSRETLEGRSTWHLRTRLRPAAPAPSGMEDLALLGPLELWIDEQTGQERQLRLVVEKPRRPLTLGTTFDVSETHFDRVFVPGRALVRRPVGKVIIETEQTYTDYKRFSSEAVVTFTPTP